MPGEFGLEQTAVAPGHAVEDEDGELALVLVVEDVDDEGLGPERTGTSGKDDLGGAELHAVETGEDRVGAELHAVGVVSCGLRCISQELPELAPAAMAQVGKREARGGPGATTGSPRSKELVPEESPAEGVDELVGGVRCKST